MDIAKILQLPTSPAAKKICGGGGNERSAGASATGLAEEISELSSELLDIRHNLELAASACDQQSKYIDEYSRELDSLQRERLAHVQQLRRLHASISSVEASLSRSEQARQRELSRARGLADRYGGLLTRLNRLRQLNCLEPLPLIGSPTAALTLAAVSECGDCAAVAAATGASSTADQMSQMQHSIPLPNLDFSSSGPPPPQPPYLQSGFQSFLTSFSFLPPTSQPSPLPISPAAVSGFHQFQQPARLPSMAASSSSTNSAARQQHRQHPSSLPPQQQQPPPMKACMSCQQQIHRNAPICPLCKAKSRSKHPKKRKSADLV